MVGLHFAKLPKKYLTAQRHKRKRLYSACTCQFTGSHFSLTASLLSRSQDRAVEQVCEEFCFFFIYSTKYF